MNRNHEIITQAAAKKGFTYDGNNLHTFAEWERKGFSVKNGEKAFIKTKIWSTGINTRLIPCCLYTNNQVIKNEKLNDGKTHKLRKIENGYHLVSKQYYHRALAQ